MPLHTGAFFLVTRGNKAFPSASHPPPPFLCKSQRGTLKFSHVSWESTLGSTGREVSRTWEWGTSSTMPGGGGAGVGCGLRKKIGGREGWGATWRRSPDPKALLWFKSRGGEGAGGEGPLWMLTTSSFLWCQNAAVIGAAFSLQLIREGLLVCLAEDRFSVPVFSG